MRPGHGSELRLGEEGGADNEKEEEEDGVLAGRITIHNTKTLQRLHAATS